MKKLFLMGTCLLVCWSVPARAQTGGADTVVVRIDYASDHQKITFRRGDTKPEVQELWGSYEQLTGWQSKLLVLLNQQGYTLREQTLPGPFPVSFLIYIKTE